jgi:hypothetical protein
MKYLTIFSAALLVACGPLLSPEKDQGAKRFLSYCNDQSVYCFEYPAGMDKIIGENDVSVISSPIDTPREERYSVQPYHISSPCSPSLTGASQTEELTTANGKAEWGRVNYRDGYGGEGWTYPYDPKNILCKIQGTPPPAQVYALCSEKDDKTVVICISQMTDNPEQAKEIFETFRWTK